jgi:ABC-type amino acid transport substrate-binding protein
MRRVVGILAILMLAGHLGALDLDAAQKAWVADHKAKGLPLSVGTVVNPGTYQPNDGGEPEGFDFRLAVALAKELGLKLKVVVPAEFKSFFAKGGVIPDDVQTNTAYTYTPDLLKTVDLYIGPFSISPWRERLMTMVAMYPMRNFLVGERGGELKSLAELDGKRIPVLKDSVQDNTLKNLAKSENLNLKLIYVTSDADVLSLLEAGKVDYVLDGGMVFSQYSSRLKDKSVSPYPEPLIRVGWSLKREDKALTGIVRTFLAQSQNSGLFETEFQRAFGVGFAPYMGLMGAGAQGGLLP